MKEIDFGGSIFPDRELGEVRMDWPFSQNGPDMYNFGKRRSFPVSRGQGKGGGGSRSRASEEKPEEGWKGPGRHSGRYPEGSDRKGGPWTRKNKGPVPKNAR